MEYFVSPQYDLKLIFDNGYSLNIFCDVGHSRNDYNNNWELIIPKDNVSIEIDNHFNMKTNKEE